MLEMKKDTLFIKREGREFDKVKFTFRYIGVNIDERNLIEKELSDLTLNINEIQNEVYVITFPLTKEIESERIKTLNEKMKLSTSKYGFYISFTTNYDHSGFRLPKEIRDFYQVVGGEFDCSIIMI